MDIRCPYCETVYEFDSRHLTPEGVTLKCSTCSKAFRVRAEPELASIFVRQGSAAPQQWPSTETVTEAILAGQGALKIRSILVGEDRQRRGVVIHWQDGHHHHQAEV